MIHIGEAWERRRLGATSTRGLDESCQICKADPAIRINHGVAHVVTLCPDCWQMVTAMVERMRERR